MTDVILQRPTGILDFEQVYVSNFYILPCLTKVIGSSRQTSYVWDIKTGQIIKRLNYFINIFYTLTPGGSQLVTCNRTDNISTIDILDLI